MEETEFADKMADRLKEVEGVVGVVLGGSRARGTHGPDSDYDVGVYYADERALDLTRLADVARELDDERRDNLIFAPGEWGRWVNGGGWLTADGRRVDFLLRDMARVERSVADSLAGIVRPHYQTGHPHAYINIMYAGELAIARILHDSDGALLRLQERMRPYPAALKEGLVRLFDFEAGFSLMLARDNVGKGDEYYVAAHVVRSLSCLNQVLFAVNEEYCINEKKAVRMIDGFSSKPDEYSKRVADIVAHTGRDAAAACDALESLIEDTRCLL